MHHIPAEKIKVNLSSSQPNLHHISGEAIKLNSTSSKSGLPHIAAEPIKLNLRSRKAQQNISSNMTVTIIQDGSAEPIELQLGQSYENVSMVSESRFWFSCVKIVGGKYLNWVQIFFRLLMMMT